MLFYHGRAFAVLCVLAKIVSVNIVFVCWKCDVADAHADDCDESFAAAAPPPALAATAAAPPPALAATAAAPPPALVATAVGPPV